MERRLAAILAADAVGYSRLMGDDEAGTLQALQRHRETLIEPKAAQYHGRIVKLMGDGVLMEFGSVVDAVTFAVEIQMALRERNRDIPAEKRIVFRIGINLGDIILQDTDIYGDGVNVASRLEELAEPGGICLSRAARDQVRDKLDLRLEDLGEIEVKNIARPVRAFKVVLDDQARSLVTPIVTVGHELERPPWKRALAGLGLLAMAVIGALWWQPWSRMVDETSVQEAAVPLPKQPSIAVLPFDNLSGDASQDYFADAVTEDITTELSRFAELFVISRESAFAYRGEPKSAKQVGRKLGVRYILEGSVQRVGDRLRVNAQLINAEDEGHIWAEKYDRVVDDLLAVQDDIVMSVVTTVGETVQRNAGENVRRRPLANFEAYDYSLKGHNLIHRPGKENNDEARHLYLKAIALDPGLSHAFVGLAWTHLREYMLQWSKTGPEALEKAADYTRKAAALGGSDYQVQRLFARIKQFQGKPAEALSHNARALELNPNDGDLLASRALLLIFSGRSEEAGTWVTKAMRRNPHHPDWYATVLAATHYLANRYRDALSVMAKVDEPAVYDHRLLAAIHGQLGEQDEARAHVKALLDINPDYSISLVTDSLPYQKDDLELFLDGLRKAGLPE
jgi:TolB-like protein/class 3 adenylate cyclase/Flp pilus assembly protein TadD